MSELTFLGKNPPKSNRLQRRLLEYQLDDNATYFSGYNTLKKELDKTAKPQKPKRSKPIDLKGPWIDIEKKLNANDYDVRVLLASLDFMTKVEVVEGSTNVFRVEMNGSPVAIDFAAPNDLEAEVKNLLKKMKTFPAPLDEALLEAEAPEVMFAKDMEMDLTEQVVTMQVIDVVANVVGAPLHVLKHVLNVKRPHLVEIDDGSGKKATIITPVIPVPGHASCPGGHAAFVAAVAEVLGRLIGGDAAWADRLNRATAQIVENRERVGLHTSFDTAEGLRLGRAIGRWMADQAEALNSTYPCWAVLYAQATAEWK